MKSSKKSDSEWVEKKIKLFAKKQKLYQNYAKKLEHILTRAAAKYAPEAIVQARAKTIPSFAEKIQRKIQNILIYTVLSLKSCY